MIALDTNILVRLVTNDDPPAAKKAAALLRRGPVFIPKTVLLEMEWVLRHAYQLEKPAILTAFRTLLGLPGVEVEDSFTITTALEWYDNGLDFADALHTASSRHTKSFATFDKALIKAAKALTIPVTEL